VYFVCEELSLKGAASFFSAYTDLENGSFFLEDYEEMLVESVAEI